MYRIEKAIPIPETPEPAQGRQKGVTETMRRMKIGDSFHLPTLNEINRCGVYKCAKLLGISIHINMHAQRIWRVSAKRKTKA